ncbi:MAG: SpoIID/LytB domain-containing protein [Oscillospiraceae bacterium]
MNKKIHKIGAGLVSIFTIITFLSAGQSANAAGTIYVNDSQSTLSGDIGSAYVIGGTGSSSIAGGDNAITGDGIRKVGQAAVPTPDPGDDGSTISVKNNIARVGLYYYYNNARDTALLSANLQNKVGSGYQFGYYDSTRVFHGMGGTTETAITMTPTGAGQEVTVTQTGTGRVLYVHNGGSGTRLAVRPNSNSGKAETWFKGHTYYGDFEYFRYVGNKLTVINVLDLEDYIKGVVPYEMSPSWPLEALKAQALCARTYFASSSNYGQYGFDLTGDTYSQAYLGTERANSATDAAVDATAGKYITYNGKLCSTFYFSSDGGGTEDCENIFVAALPYLRGVIDPYEQDVPASMNSYKSWQREFTGEQLAAKVGLSGAVVSVSPEYSDTNNVIRLTLSNASGDSKTLTKYACCTGLSLPSVHYTITQSGNTFVIDGSGWGHNVGMSQWGAYSMAKNHGMNANQIIKFYFTGVKISTGV